MCYGKLQTQMDKGSRNFKGSRMQLLDKKCFQKYDNITPILMDLHLLKVWQHIDYKILTITFKALYNNLNISGPNSSSNPKITDRALS